MAKKRLRSYKQKNERRHQLIDKKYGRWGLKKEEEVELKELMNDTLCLNFHLNNHSIVP